MPSSCRETYFAYRDRSCLKPQTGRDIFLRLLTGIYSTKLPVERVLQDVIDTDGGPPLHNGSAEEQRPFDSTCRRLHRLLTHTGRAHLLRGKKVESPPTPPIGGQQSPP
jgi:hypothetical protein